MWSVQIKEKAIQLRKQGYSYGQLIHELHVPKSTLSEWVTPYKRTGFSTPEDRANWARLIQPLGVAGIKLKRQTKLDDIDHRIHTEFSGIYFDLSHKKALLAMLYWSEGNKGRHDCFTIANTDPQLLQTCVTILRQCFQIDETKFRLRLHLHSYHNETDQIDYWSNLLSIPLNQFQKTYWKPRNTNKHFRENSHGICFLRYNDIYLKEELVRLGLAISGKITSEFNAPVVQRIE